MQVVERLSPCAQVVQFDSVQPRADGDMLMRTSSLTTLSCQVSGVGLLLVSLQSLTEAGCGGMTDFMHQLRTQWKLDDSGNFQRSVSVTVALESLPKGRGNANMTRVREMWLHEGYALAFCGRAVRAVRSCA